MSRASRVLLALVLPCLGCDTSSSSAHFVLLDDAEGLRAGSTVYVAGVQSGRVRSVRLEEARARVDFELSPESGVTLKSDACVSVGRYGASGDAHLRVEPGVAGEALPREAEVTCVRAAAGDEPAKKAPDAVEQVARELASGKGLLGRLLRDEKLAGNVERFFERAAKNERDPDAAADSGGAEAPAPPKPPGPAPAPKPRSFAPARDAREVRH